MARSWYGGTPADFVVALGDPDTIPGSSPTADGYAALIPEDSVTLLVYDEDFVQVTDLLDVGGVGITSVSTSVDLASLGTIPRFQGPDGYDHDLYVAADGETFFRLPPSTSDLADRTTALELSLGGLSLDDMVDVTTSGASNGQVLTYSAGTWGPDDGGSGSVSSINGITPTAGDVALAPTSLVPAAAAASGLAAVTAIVGARLLQAGGGYPGRPSAAQYVIYIGTATPVTGVQNGDIWYQPASA